MKNVPKNGAFVETPDGYGNVTQVNVLRQTVKVKLDGPGDDTFHTYDAEDVAAIPGGRPRDGSQPPHVLVLRPKEPKEPEEPENNGWEMPERLISSGESRPVSVRQEVARKTGGKTRPHREQPEAEVRDGAGKHRSPRSHTPKQPAAAQAAGAEAAPSPGQGKRRNRKRLNKGAHGDSTPRVQQAEAAPKAQQGAPKAQQGAPKAQQGDGAPKQKKPYRIRRHHNKPKGGGQAPKAGE